MTLIIDETFEGTGYEESWAESVTAPNIVDEDADPADVSNPSGWGSQCLRIDHQNNNFTSYASRTFTAEAISYFRTEIVISSSNLTGGEIGFLLAGYGSGGLPDLAYNILLYKQGAIGDLKFRLYCYHDGSNNIYDSFGYISLNTRYTLEVKWDASANKWAWRINGINQKNDQDSVYPVTAEGNLTSTHKTDIDEIRIGLADGEADSSFEAYYDKVALDDSAWVNPAQLQLNFSA